MMNFYVISHTHWDREWYLPLERMKWKLCDLINHCIEILQTQENYIFHLDAQIVVLEDYFSVYPEKREILESFIRQRRLMIGPWYVQNDFFLSSGEATIRNLLEGRRLAEKMGYCDQIGYAPDQFGIISQLPQILQGFGIDNFVFGRGYPEHLRQGEHAPTEFLWRGADGTEILAIWMKLFYNNAQRIPEDEKEACLLLQKNKAELGPSMQTDHMLLMNGVDHLEPQSDVLPAIENVRKSLQQGESIQQCRLSDYIRMIQNDIRQREIALSCHEGELRDGADTFILKGTLSSRSYLKAENVRAQTMLEQRLEPLYAMLELYGLRGVYPREQIRFLWRELIKNLPHDSICGCSCDEVHRRMEDSYRSLAIATEDLMQRAMQCAIAHLKLPGRDENNYILAIANTTQMVYDSVAEAVIDLPESDQWKGFRILNAKGEAVPYEILSRKKTVHDCFSPLNLPGRIPVTRCRIDLKTGPVEPFAIKGFLILPAESWQETVTAKPCANVLENEYLKVHVDNSGRVSILDKQTGRHIHDALELEDVADCGDVYVFEPDRQERAVYASSFPAEISVERNDSLVQQLTIHRVMQIPQCYDFSRRCRSEEKIRMPVAVTLRLCDGMRWLHADVAAENTAKDHRLRLLVRTGIATDVSVADAPFDVMYRKDQPLGTDCWSDTKPNTSFAALEDTFGGVAVFTEGAHEYEHLPDGNLAFTVLRATGLIRREYWTLEQVGGDQWVSPENQCLKKITMNFGIAAYQADAATARIPQLAAQFRTGVYSFFFPSDGRRFQRGRAVVQDAGVNDFYYLPDAYAGIEIPENRSALEITPDVMVTALKKAENRDDMVLRLVNLRKHGVQASLSGPFETKIISMDEHLCGEENRNVENVVRSKEIRTYLLIQPDSGKDTGGQGCEIQP